MITLQPLGSLEKHLIQVLKMQRLLLLKGGASQITVHLREDRRHIQDEDVRVLAKYLKKLPAVLNLEMAATLEMAEFALSIKPDWVCLVPEKREEVTTEGGLDLVGHYSRIETVIKNLRKQKIKVSHCLA